MPLSDFEDQACVASLPWPTLPQPDLHQDWVIDEFAVAQNRKSPQGVGTRRELKDILFGIHRVASFSRLLPRTPQRFELVDRESERGIRGTNLPTNEKDLA
jgi:hypothetical protein